MGEVLSFEHSVWGLKAGSYQFFFQSNSPTFFYFLEIFLSLFPFADLFVCSYFLSYSDLNLMPQSILYVPWYLCFVRPVLLICSTWKHYNKETWGLTLLYLFLKFFLRSVKTDAQRMQSRRQKDFHSALALKLFRCCHNYSKIMEIGYMFSHAGKNALSLHIWDQLVIVKYILHSFRTRLTGFYTFCSAYLCISQPFTRLFPVQ